MRIPTPSDDLVLLPAEKSTAQMRLSCKQPCTVSCASQPPLPPKIKPHPNVWHSREVTHPATANLVGGCLSDRNPTHRRPLCPVKGHASWRLR
jgi:hypothetical protein